MLWIAHSFDFSTESTHRLVSGKFDEVISPAGPTWVSQYIPTVPGEEYVLCYDQGAQSEGVSTTEYLLSRVIGATSSALHLHSIPATNPATFDALAYDFVASSPFTLIEFQYHGSGIMAGHSLLDDVRVAGPWAPRFPIAMASVTYGGPVVISGPPSGPFGLSALPETFPGVFALHSESAESMTAGLSDVAASLVSFGDGQWPLAKLASFSLETDATGEMTTLSYTTAPINTLTVGNGVIFSNSFSATITGIDKANGQPFEYHYANSVQNLMGPAPTVPVMDPHWLPMLVCLLGGAALVATRAFRPARSRDWGAPWL